MEKEMKRRRKSFIRLLLIGFSIFIILLLSFNVSGLERSVSKNLQVNSVVTTTGLTCKQAGMCFCGGRDDSRRVDDGWCDLACITTFGDCSPSFCECNCPTPTQCSCTSPTQCDDKKKCTTDNCSSSKICTHVPIPGCVDPCDTLNCDDANACTTDTCELGSCKHTLITCPIPGQICSNQKCSPCVPQCSGKQCGPDGCLGSCGTCPSGYNCNVGKCVCIPKTCSQLGKSCGNIDNGCGTKIDCGGCDDKNDCTYDSCNIYSGGCQYDNAPDGSSCNLGLASLSPLESFLKFFGLKVSATGGTGKCNAGVCASSSKCTSDSDCGECGAWGDPYCGALSQGDFAGIWVWHAKTCHSCNFDDGINNGKCVDYIVSEGIKGKKCSGTDNPYCINATCVKKCTSPTDPICGIETLQSKYCSGGGDKDTDLMGKYKVPKCSPDGFCTTPIEDRKIEDCGLSTCKAWEYSCRKDSKGESIHKEQQCLDKGCLQEDGPLDSKCSSSDYINVSNQYCSSDEYCDSTNGVYSCKKKVCTLDPDCKPTPCNKCDFTSGSSGNKKCLPDSSKNGQSCTGTDSNGNSLSSLFCLNGGCVECLTAANCKHNICQIEKCESNSCKYYYTPKKVEDPGFCEGDKFCDGNGTCIYKDCEKDIRVCDSGEFCAFPKCTINMTQYGATWCQYCGVLKNTIQSFINEYQGVICHKYIDVGEDRSRTLPYTEIFVGSNKIGSFSGAMAKDTLKNYLDSELKKLNGRGFKKCIKNPTFNSQNNPMSLGGTSIFVVRDANNFDNSKINGLAYVISPHVTFNVNATLTINYSYYYDILNPRTYVYEDHDAVLGLCDSELISSVSKDVGGSEESVLNLGNEITLDIPANALDSITNMNIFKYNLSDCYNPINDSDSCLNKTCNDYNSCTVDSCSGENCIFTPIPDGTSCDLTSPSNLSPLQSFINFFERTGNLITNFLTNKQSLSVCKSGQCISCTPQCSGKQCGDDSCGGTCGSCLGGQTCNLNGQCIPLNCIPQCSGKQCGTDSVCGISCGTCNSGQTCNSLGQCINSDCIPQCSGKQCGTDLVCGISCGTCASGQTCNLNNQCVSCTPECSGKSCGDDSCGGTCGSCLGGQTCNSLGQCINSDCTPECSGKQCGIDPVCGISCGTCPSGQICNANQQCITNPTPGVKCNKNSDCGTDSWIGSLFCQNGNVYQNYITYSCNNPGADSSSCSNSTSTLLKQTCSSSQSCSNGVCVKKFKTTTIGLYNPSNSNFYLRNSNTAGYADNTFAYGATNNGWTPISGDWDGDGKTTIGFYETNPTTSKFYLRNSNTAGYADLTFSFGAANKALIPISGDWDSDGKTTIGLYDLTTSTFYLRNSNTQGVADITFAYGAAGTGLPISGDWDSDGKTTIGLYNPLTSTFYLRNSNSAGYADITFAYGNANNGWLAITGDWDGDGKTTIGLYNPTTSTFYLRNTNTAGYADITFAYGAGNSGWKPIAGDWDGV